MSTKTGLRLLFITDTKVDFQVIAGIMTSSFFFNFKDLRHRYNASVPFATPIEYFVLQNFEKFFQNNLTSSVSIKLFFYTFLIYCLLFYHE